MSVSFVGSIIPGGLPANDGIVLNGIWTTPAATGNDPAKQLPVQAPRSESLAKSVWAESVNLNSVIGHMPVSRLEPRFQGLSVSPDGSIVVFAKYVSEGDDLMMIDNFR